VREFCIREQKPYLIECMTFRMRGHEEASGTKYIPAELFEVWGKKDPVVSYENWLKEEGMLDEGRVNDIRAEFRTVIENAIAVPQHPVIADTKKETEDMYAPVPEHSGKRYSGSVDTEGAPVKRFIDGIRDGLWQSMEENKNLILMGQDIAEYGGAFKITEGFLETFGHDRVRNTPLCESAIVGTALGLGLEGFKSVMEMQFADFAAVGFNQIVNNLAKIHYRWGQPADVVIRMPTGAGVGAGPFHSQSNEAWFTHVPGLKVVYPSTPADAKGLLVAAILDPNPVLFFEHKVLYRSISGPLPEHYYSVEIGKATLVAAGTDITIITYGAGVHWALSLAAEKPDISFHILDLRTLLPLDYEAIRESVAKTGRVIILHEDTLTGGIGGEISAWIGEHCFELLDGPVMRCASLDTAIPFNIDLEKNFLANNRLLQTLAKLLAY
jgi:2-oxoisovalerate dehydrogenase E1 component